MLRTRWPWVFTFSGAKWYVEMALTSDLGLNEKVKQLYSHKHCPLLFKVPTQNGLYKEMGDMDLLT